jgi:hypothetical protein
MSDPYSNHTMGLESPAYRHFSITPGDSDLAVRPRALYVNADGNLVVRDIGGVDVTYAVVKGQILPIRAVQVRAATTATVIGWY